MALALFAQCSQSMKTHLATITPEQLAEVSGGMKWEQFRPSTNVEDRRPAWAKRRDDAWFRAQQQPSQPQPVPLPLPRPAGT